MGWEIGYEPERDRDISYGVPAECDHPACQAKIDRGLSYVCGSEPYGGEHGCGLFFCEKHLLMAAIVVGLAPASGEWVQLCERCETGAEPFEPKADLKEWTDFKATDPSWAEWRAEQAAGHRRRSA
jgi:hypothetical protein